MPIREQPAKLILTSAVDVSVIDSAHVSPPLLHFPAVLPDHCHDTPCKHEETPPGESGIHWTAAIKLLRLIQ
jgi:hypothetical protein